MGLLEMPEGGAVGAGTLIASCALQPTAPVAPPATVRMRRWAAALLLTPLALPASARADPETQLFDLLMAWESVSICGFEMPDEAADRAYTAIAAYEADLGKSEGEILELREQAAWQILRQKQEMCAPDGSWRARYDELVATLKADAQGQDG